MSRVFPGALGFLWTAHCDVPPNGAVVGRGAENVGFCAVVLESVVVGPLI